MAQPILILRGQLVHTPQCGAVTTLPNGFLVCENGRITGAFATLPAAYAGLPVTDYGDRLILPGLVDLHVHAPQYPFRGLGTDLELLPWLQAYTFPEEARYASLDYARPAYQQFVSDLTAGATTRACVFATLHLPATMLLMDLLEQSGLQTYVGKVNMDRNSIPLLTELTQPSIEDTLRWLADCRGQYQSVQPILTPRFIPACSDELLAGLAAIQKQSGLPVQSHLSESRAEVAWVQELCPTARSYGDAYARFGLFGGDVPTVMAHCVHPTPLELDLMERQRIWVAHCPQSNANLSSGVAPIRTYLNRGMHVGLGSDVAGGADLSLFAAMRDAIRASKLRGALLEEPGTALSVAEVVYMATKGGGSFWGDVGSFEPGFACDVIVLDDMPFCAFAEYATLSQRLERVVSLADDRCVVAKYVCGRRVFDRI